MTKTAWRADTVPGEVAEFVLVSGWNTIEEHTEFAQTPQAVSRLSEVMQLVERTETKHYKRVL
jgi:hypothetical protein